MRSCSTWSVFLSFASRGQPSTLTIANCFLCWHYSHLVLECQEYCSRCSDSYNCLAEPHTPRRHSTARIADSNCLWALHQEISSFSLRLGSVGFTGIDLPILSIHPNASVPVWEPTNAFIWFVARLNVWMLELRLNWLTSLIIFHAIEALIVTLNAITSCHRTCEHIWRKNCLLTILMVLKYVPRCNLELDCRFYEQWIQVKHLFVVVLMEALLDMIATVVQVARSNITTSTF